VCFCVVFCCGPQDLSTALQASLVHLPSLDLQRSWEIELAGDLPVTRSDLPLRFHNGRYDHCFRVNHTCSRFRFSISSWSTGSPALTQFYLNPLHEVGLMQWDEGSNVCQLYMTSPTSEAIDCGGATAARPICACT